MWRPPERIQYTSEAGQVPSREEAERSRLFSPLQEGRLTLASARGFPRWCPGALQMTDSRPMPRRLVRAACARSARRNRRGATGIRNIPSGPLLRIGDDCYVEGLGGSLTP